VLEQYSHTSFTVSDLERSVDFYVNILGMKDGGRHERVGSEIEGVTGVADAHLKMATVLLGDLTLEFVQYVSGAGTKLDPRPNNVGAPHIAFTVRNLNQVYQDLIHKGVRSYGKPTPLTPPGLNRVYICDPDGITIELIEISA